MERAGRTVDSSGAAVAVCVMLETLQLLCAQNPQALVLFQGKQLFNEDEAINTDHCQITIGINQ